jgi:AcrR family transcriptional regulator
MAAHKDQQRRHIVATALALVAEHGLADVSMSLLARRAGIARATLYNYFPDLESVLAAAVADQVTTVISQLRRDTDPAGQLDRTIRALLGWLARRPRTGNHADPMGRLSPHVIATLHEPLDRIRELVSGIVRRGVADGTFTATADPGLHAEFIVQLLFGLDSCGDDAHQQAVGDQLPRFVLRGLGYQAGAG